MTTRRTFFAVGAALLAGSAVAHPLTEKFIPMGSFPNWDRDIVAGRLDAVDAGAKTISVGNVRARVTDDTYIWLDRSHKQQTTLDGDFDALRRGREVELKVSDGRAVWVKVKAE